VHVYIQTTVATLQDALRVGRLEILIEMVYDLAETVIPAHLVFMCVLAVGYAMSYVVDRWEQVE
jgi:hypothetical protein